MNATAVIVTLNEERAIARAIESVRSIFNEVLVVDSFSTDKTVEIARSLGAVVYQQEYLGDGFQKRFAVERARNDWIFVLDADEIAPRGIEEAIKEVGLDPAVVYRFRRRNYIGSRWVKHGGAYPDPCARLFHRGHHEITPSVEHCTVHSARYVDLRLDIDHYSHRDYSSLYAKTVRHAYRSAKSMYAKHSRPKSAAASGAWMFIKLYFFRGGFLDGTDGLHHAFSASLRSFLKYSFLREFYSDPAVRDRTDFNKIF